MTGLDGVNGCAQSIAAQSIDRFVGRSSDFVLNTASDSLEVSITRQSQLEALLAELHATLSYWKVVRELTDASHTDWQDAFDPVDSFFHPTAWSPFGSPSALKDFFGIPRVPTSMLIGLRQVLGGRLAAARTHDYQDEVVEVLRAFIQLEIAAMAKERGNQND